MPKEKKPKAGTPNMGSGLIGRVQKLITERQAKREEILDFVGKGDKNRKKK